MSIQQSNAVKYVSLIVLTLQATLAVLAMRYSRKEDTRKEELYIVTTCILVSELVKLLTCLVILLIQKSGSISQWLSALASDVIYKPFETAKLAIPSSLFILQSNLILLALSSLDAATFQVTYQLKIITTALFSVMILRRTIRPLQWLALVILMAGVVIAQLSTEKGKQPAPSISGNQTDLAAQASQAQNTVIFHRQYVIGMTAILVSALSSGFAGVYYEKLLKESAQPSVIIRNIQLGLFSIPFCAAGVLLKDFEKVLRRGFFAGYSPVVWLVVFLHAGGGLAVAAVIKYADNILKGFSTSISIVLSCIVSSAVFHDLDLDLNFIIGAGLVIVATFLYGGQSHQASSSTVIHLSPNDLKKASVEIP